MHGVRGMTFASIFRTCCDLRILRITRFTARWRGISVIIEFLCELVLYAWVTVISNNYCPNLYAVWNQRCTEGIPRKIWWSRMHEQLINASEFYMDEIIFLMNQKCVEVSHDCSFGSLTSRKSNEIWFTLRRLIVLVIYSPENACDKTLVPKSYIK